MKIKVLHVLGGLSTGGAETLFVSILKNIDLDKYHFDVVIHRPELNDYEEIVKKYGCNIYVCPAFSFLNIKLYKNWWKNFFKEHNDYDIVHGHMTSTAAIYLKIAKTYGVKTISHIHSVSYGFGIKSLLKTHLGKKAKKYADKRIGCSIEACKFIYGNSDYTVLKNGINVKNFEFNDKDRKLIRSHLNINDDELLVGTIGRIVPIKNPYYVVDLVSSSKANYKFLWVGNGSEKNNIISKIKELGITDKFIFINSTTETSKYYSAMDVFVFPSIKEGLGISLIEAQANGLPCVISKGIPSSAIITDLVTVFDVNKKEINSWNKAIEDVNPNTNKRKTYNSIVLKSGYDISEVTSSIIEIYNSLVVKC